VADELKKLAELNQAGALTDEEFAEHARSLRDVLEHFDQYAVGDGRRRKVAPDARRALPYFVQASNAGDVANLEFRLGELSVPVKEVADEAMRLAEVIEEVRQDFV